MIVQLMISMVLLMITLSTGLCSESVPHKESAQTSAIKDEQGDNEGNGMAQEPMDYYIVVFKEDATTQDVISHKDMVKQMIGASKLEHEYAIGDDFRGYSALMSEHESRKIESHPSVKYVKQSKNLYFGCEFSQCPAPWGLVRLTTRSFNANLNKCYHHNSNGGKGVNIYVIDSGIDTTHPDFQGRAKWGYDLLDGLLSSGTDTVGHGTHVAGIAMSRTYGVAKKATAIAVRACMKNKKGLGICPGHVVIASVDWVAKQHKPSNKSVVNLSLGMRHGFVPLDEALSAAVKQGIHISVSAGNFWVNACGVSPSRDHEVVTVGAIDMNNKAYYDYGRCVDISAPGIQIMSTFPNGRIAVLSGTSMSSPHVAGAMAVILEHENLTPIQMKRKLQSMSTKNQMKNLRPGTPNSILYIDC